MAESHNNRQNTGTQHASRRQFIRNTIASAAVAAFPVGHVLAEQDRDDSPEALVARLYASLNQQQKKQMAFPFDHSLRSDVDNNWHITEAVIGDTFNPDQQQLIKDIFMGLHSEQYAQTVLKQVEHDNRNTNRQGGFAGCTVAMFGDPSTGPYEFVLTGRHVTRRVDGNSSAATAFGGPIFYGHAAEGFNEKPDHPGNVYWYQAKRANELFQALDGSQRNLALRSDPRPEQQKDTVRLRGQNAELHGIPVSELTADQKTLARQVMKDVLAPFRETDVAEAMSLLEASGFDNLHFAYYQNMDVGNDRVWDVWQIEGPNAVWYFRGDPHVHTWVHIRGES
jgi:hypothetical protein